MPALRKEVTLLLNGAVCPGTSKCSMRVKWSLFSSVTGAPAQVTMTRRFAGCVFPLAAVPWEDWMLTVNAAVGWGAAGALAAGFGVGASDTGSATSTGKMSFTTGAGAGRAAGGGVGLAGALAGTFAAAFGAGLGAAFAAGFVTGLLGALVAFAAGLTTFRAGAGLALLAGFDGGDFFFTAGTGFLAEPFLGVGLLAMS